MQKVVVVRMQSTAWSFSRKMRKGRGGGEGCRRQLKATWNGERWPPDAAAMAICDLEAVQGGVCEGDGGAH